MKLYLILSAAVAFILLISPLAAVDFSEKENTQIEEASDAAVNEEQSDSISVFMPNDETVEEMDMLDYIVGTVAAEMPALYHEEALKAQALAAVTYALYLRENGNNENYDISASSSTHQGYITEEEMKEKWGASFEEYHAKIENAAKSVIDKVITYNGKPIMSAYHAISSGKTESAENIWGKPSEYLVSVDSEGDVNSPRFETEVMLTESEIKNTVKEVYGEDYDKSAKVISISETSDTGTVLTAYVCGVKLSGMEIRSMFSLRSPAFTVTCDGDEYVFSVKGYGHGVGMSQYGADYLAKKGFDYTEIIAHYYPNTKIESRFS